MQGPIRWINQFGWRPIMQWEKWALFVLWRELSVMLGCKWVPQDLATFDEFEKVRLSPVHVSEYMLTTSHLVLRTNRAATRSRQCNIL